MEVVEGQGNLIDDWYLLYVTLTCFWRSLMCSTAKSNLSVQKRNQGVTGRTGYAGVGLNPARFCLGPSLLKGGRLWYGYRVYWVGSFY
ncbi:hypothetical protein DKX38_014502 [Salix brachista]|uniref:Uncharacterized protein n=1 Tax=Salix brachista TaxID=2182728 RepID=A0A5N5LGB6_9ROSI|nr:hypothetical protein DKX38_014502 [Salix brachista]